MDLAPLQLVVETPNGTFVRFIRPATVLPEAVTRGAAAESATRSAVALWGLPDFVFRPAITRRGSGSRELGDTVVVVGEMAASVQVKSRTAPGDSVDRERSWLTKNIERGARQAAGTIRNLRASDAVLANERGRQVRIGGPNKAWLPIVIVDGGGVEGYVPRSDAIVLLRRDWEFLFQQLKSTYAVLEYLRRIGAEAPIPLGHEPFRYYQLAAADAVAPPTPPDPRLRAYMSTFESTPLLPQAPAGHGDDHNHLLVRGVLEDITTSALPGGIDEAERLDVLAAIDATPVGYRAALGAMWLSWLQDAAKENDDEIRWRFRGHIWPDRPYLIFGVTGRHSAEIQRVFGLYVRLRHQQQAEVMPERVDMPTVGVLLTIRRDGRPPFDTTVVATRGDQEIAHEDRVLLERLWGGLGESIVLDKR